MSSFPFLTININQAMSSSTMPRAIASGSGSGSGSNSSQNQNESVKRSRYGTAPEEYFDQQAPEEKIRLTAQFRDLMSKAEGMWLD